MTKETITADSGKRGWPRLAFERFRKWATLALFFLLPLQTRYLIREVPLYEWGTLSVFLVEALGWVVIALLVIKIKNEKLKIQNVWLLSLPFFAFLSIAWAPDKPVALQAAVRLLEVVLLFLVLSNPSSLLQKARGGMGGVMVAFLASATFQALLGIYQFLTQSSFASTILGMAFHDPAALGTAVVEAGGARWLRAYGSLPHPNVLGGYLVVALAMVLRIWVDRISEASEIRSRYLGLAIVPILLTGIFFSFSRSAWGGVVFIVVGGVIGQILTRRQMRKSEKMLVSKNDAAVLFLPKLLLLAYTLFLLIVYWPLVAARVVPQSRLEIKSRTERIEGAREAWKIVRAHPIFGVGIGNYTQVVARDLRPNRPRYSYQPVHSVPLLIWAELGTVGLLLFLSILWYMARASKNYWLLAIGYWLLLFDHYLWSSLVGILLFWAYLGLSTSIDKEGS